MYFENRLLNWIANFYGWIVNVASNLQSIFIFFLRIIWGHQFFIMGLDKLQNIHTTALLFESLGIPFPKFHVYMAGSIELIGGILLIVGLASRLISIPLILILIVALGTAHVHIFSEFQFVLDPSLLLKQPPFPFLITAFILFIFGPGKISFDAWIKKRFQRKKKYL